jgi:very-short-patch-repair endonuclease
MMENIKLSRNCPKCSKEIFYKRKGDLQQGIKNNTICKQCVADNRVIDLNPKQYKRNCPECKSEILYRSLKNKNRAEKLNKKCKKCCSPFKDNVNLKLSETLNKIYGPKRIIKQCKTCDSKFSVTKWEENRIYCSFNCYINDDIKKGEFKPSFNKKACEFFDKLNESKRWNGMHGNNGGEKKIKKYWVDYYEPNLNIVIEWDEKEHNYPKNKEKDKIRQQEIINYLNCSFYRIEEKTLDVIKVNKNGTEERYKKDYWFNNRNI